MLDLYAPNTEGKRPRPDERFHLQIGQPWCEGWGWDWLYRSVEWYGIYREDGFPGQFKSYVLLWFIRWYIGNVKCDSTRTGMYWNLQLEDGIGEQYIPDIPIPDRPKTGKYVMTTTPKEWGSLRFHGKPLDREVWTGMGNI